MLGHYFYYTSKTANKIDNQMYDFISTTLKKEIEEGKNSNVVVVDIDEKSLHQLGQWPWPRIITAKLIYKINSYNPSAIGLDILFPEKDRTSPNEITSFYKKYFNFQGELKGIPEAFKDNDTILSKAFEKSSSVPSIYLSNDFVIKKECTQPNGLAIDLSHMELHSFNDLLCNITSLKSSAQYSGFVNKFVDADSILRRTPLVSEYNGIFIPSLSLATLLSIDSSIEVDKNSFNILNHKVSTDDRTNVLLRFYDAKWYKKVSVIDLFNNRVPPEKLTGKIVLLGSSSISLHDQVIVTGGEKVMGAKVHVTLIDNILNNDFLTQPKYFKFLNTFISLMLSLLVLFLFIKKFKKSLVLLLVTIVVAAPLITLYLYENGVYISIGYFILPFIAYLFLIAIVYIILDRYDIYLYKEELTKAHIADLDKKVKERTAELVQSHKHIQDNINYASLIQFSLLPQKEVLQKYTKDAFVFWRPRDVVGGDIYFASELSSEKEILVMVIDGAGHGVSGAFITLLAKTIETQIVDDIANGLLEPSPALILSYFNKKIKYILRQEHDSKSNVGFDGGVLYYNTQTNVCKYAGAKTPIYIINGDEIEVIKSDRKNVGFVRTKIDQTYTDYEIEIKDNTKLYIATDGIYDQESNNHVKYGKRAFTELVQNLSSLSFSKQKDGIIDEFEKFKNGCEQNDDITVLGLQFR